MSYNDSDLPDPPRHRALDPSCGCDGCDRMDEEDRYGSRHADHWDEDRTPEGEQGSTDDEPDSIPF